ncbi:MAG: hypothetical protein K1X89_25730 [Myxococcaceae bacterium]|nr:hypothetical protein [Myxococcaceae bacterium]
MTSVSFILLLSIQSGWQVEQTPLAPSGWEVRDAVPIDDEAVGVIATRTSDAGTSMDGVFLARGGSAPLALGTFPQAQEWTGAGTGFTVGVLNPDGGLELSRVRRDGGAAALTSLGTFKQSLNEFGEPVGERVSAVSCDSAVSECAVVISGGTAFRWSRGVRTLLDRHPRPHPDPFMVAQTIEYLVEPWGAAMSPDAKWLALGVGNSTVLSEPGKPGVTVLALERTLKLPTLKAFAAQVRQVERAERAHPPTKSWDRPKDLCRTVPLGWRDGKLEVAQEQSSNDVGSEPCPLTPELFTFDPLNGRREPIPDYPWRVLECPQGGWTSKFGTFVTSCPTPEQQMKKSRQGPTTEREELPEAVGLSETEIFVMAPKKMVFRWYRGAPEGKGLPFDVEGPSVITFRPDGVLVESVDWRHGSAIFRHPMLDDWHVIEGSHGRALVRLRRGR